MASAKPVKILLPAFEHAGLVLGVFADAIDAPVTGFGPGVDNSQACHSLRMFRAIEHCYPGAQGVSDQVKTFQV